ncbi:hypothetical protein MTO96_017581 [Rhipicephalus appendiculatus]
MEGRLAALFFILAVLTCGASADDATARGVFSASVANEEARIEGRQLHVERNDVSAANEEARIEGRQPSMYLLQVKKLESTAVSFKLRVTKSAVSCIDYETEDSVLILKESNFEPAIKDHQHVFVMFYAPWCGHCKAMAPEYVKAAKQLEEEGSDIKLAKVDASVERQLAEQHDLRGFPTLKFFRYGQPLQYKIENLGARTADEMMRWLKTKAETPARPLTTVDEARAFVDSAEVVVVGFFKDQTSEEAKE